MVIQSVLLKFSDQCHAVGSIHISCLAQFIGHQCLLAGLWRCWLLQDTLMTTVNRNTGYLLRVLVVCLQFTCFGTERWLNCNSYSPLQSTKDLRQRLSKIRFCPSWGMKLFFQPTPQFGRLSSSLGKNYVQICLRNLVSAQSHVNLLPPHRGGRRFLKFKKGKLE